MIAVLAILLSFSSLAVADHNSEVRSTQALSPTENDILRNSEIKDMKDFRARIGAANRSGIKYLIVQVGSLQQCIPCKKLHAELQREYKDSPSVRVYDFDFFAYRDAGQPRNQFVDFIRSGTPQLNFPKGDAWVVPHVFIFEVPSTDSNRPKDYPTSVMGLPNQVANLPAIKERIQILQKASR